MEIQTALDDLRARRPSMPDPASTGHSPSIQQIPPEQIRFSQTTAGGNGRAAFHRKYVQENGKIIAPVDAVRTPDGIVTIDNTRVAVAREQGLATIPVKVWNESDPLPADMPSRRFGGARTWDEALQYRTALQRPKLSPTGTTTTPRMPGK